MKKKSLVKLWDVVIIAVAFALTGVSVWYVYLIPRDTTQVLITGQNNRRWVYPLEATETVSVPGPLGNTIVKIQDEETWVDSSPCDNQVCVAAGKLRGRGHFAACLPNNVLLMIEGTNDLRTYDGGSW